MMGQYTWHSQGYGRKPLLSVLLCKYLLCVFSVVVKVCIIPCGNLCVTDFIQDVYICDLNQLIDMERFCLFS